MARKKARELLCGSGVKILPVDPIGIIKCNGWGLKTVGELVQETKLRYTDIINGWDGEVRFWPEGNKYCIVYNERAYEDRIPYNLAHEIGHIMLGHSKELYLLRKTGIDLTDEQYKWFEDEAEAFASELLMPTPVLVELGIVKSHDIRRFCGVSKSAATTKSNFLKSYIVYKHELETTINTKRQFRDFINLYQRQFHLISEEHYSVESDKPDNKNLEELALCLDDLT